MKKILEKISLLGLSFMLISSFSISSALPKMKEFFAGYAPSQVELLVSVPSFFVILTLLSNRLISRWLTEHQIIIAGLLTMSIAGVFPFFVQDYTLMLLSRMLFGIGTGLINAIAISIISEHYTGREKVTMLGLRGSAEVVGGAFLTLLVGQAIHISWTWAFLIYLFGLLILALYLFFAPKEKRALKVEEQQARAKLSKQHIFQAIWMAAVAAWVICINSSISLRVPEIVVGHGFGTTTNASTLLSLQQLVGIVAGISFATLLHRLKRHLLVFANIGLALSLLGMSTSSNIWLLGLFAIGSGYFYSIALTTLFNQLSERIPLALLNSATALVLVGCNLGSAISPYVLQLLSALSVSGLAIFAVFGMVTILVALVIFGSHRFTKRIG